MLLLRSRRSFSRSFEHPASYALLRITRAGDACFEDCFDKTKPPVVIVGPRAGQTRADVLHAVRRFVEDVAKRHPGKPPVLYGNCQAGSAITLRSADCEGLVGPVVLNGSPLFYWTWQSGANPMRIAGGLLGGVWLTHFLADLGDGRFDGAWLVQNFENLKPEAIRRKYATHFANIDVERERFLEFERRWNGFYFLSRQEILAVMENLFIGNQVEEGKFRPGCLPPRHLRLRKGRASGAPSDS